jgi:AcrR family transcriptional regulator
MVTRAGSTTRRGAAAGADDHRKKRRRRGEVLHRAIFDATLRELAETGYAQLAMERVAERARTSKASLYRRWPGRAALVIDAIHHALPAPDDLPDTGDLRTDILTFLREMAAVLAGPLGAAARGLLAEALGDPQLAQAVRERITEPGLERMSEILERATRRGEISARSLTPLVVSVGPTLLRHHFLVHGAPVPDTVLTGIVDDVVLPLIGARSARDSRS